RARGQRRRQPKRSERRRRSWRTWRIGPDARWGASACAKPNRQSPYPLDPETDPALARLRGRAMDLSDCRDACTQTHLICGQTAVHVLMKGEEHPRDLVRTLWDCSDICIAAANILNRGSPLQLHMTACRACADICEACAESCSGRDDPILRA